MSYAEVSGALSEVVKEQSFRSLFKVGGDLVAAFFLGGLLLAAVMTPLTYWFVKSLVDRRRARRASAGVQ